MEASCQLEVRISTSASGDCPERQYGRVLCSGEQQRRAKTLRSQMGEGCDPDPREGQGGDPSPPYVSLDPVNIVSYKTILVKYTIVTKTYIKGCAKKQS